MNSKIYVLLDFNKGCPLLTVFFLLTNTDVTLFLGLTHSHDRVPSSDTLPIVCTDENVNSSLQTLPLSSKNRSHNPPMQSNTTTPKSHHTTPTKTQRVNSLSISGTT